MPDPTTHTMKVYGKWFYKSHGHTKDLSSVPHERWKFLGMIPGQFDSVSPTDEKEAKVRGADVILLGQGENFIVNILD